MCLTSCRDGAGEEGEEDAEDCYYEDYGDRATGLIMIMANDDDNIEDAAMNIL